MAPSQSAREWDKLVTDIENAICYQGMYHDERAKRLKPLLDALLAQQTAASELKGWQNAINSVRSSLQQYPNAGGDIEIMQAVEKIVNEKTAAKDAQQREYHDIANRALNARDDMDAERNRQQVRAEAVERERDSLVTKCKNIRRLVAFALRNPKNITQELLRQIDTQANVAGKDEQK